MTRNAYAQSGVDVEAGYEVVARIKKHVARTERLGVLGTLGGFGGMFDLSRLDVKEPVLISGTDGVGTKLMLAIKYDKHDTIGQDINAGYLDTCPKESSDRCCIIGTSILASEY